MRTYDNRGGTRDTSENSKVGGRMILADTIRASVALLQRTPRASARELRAMLEALTKQASPAALALEPSGERAYIVELDPLLCVRVYASSEEGAEERACEQLARDDFSNAATCSEIRPNVQCVRLADDHER